MACTYCCAGGGTYGGNEELMSIETAKHAVDSLMRLGRFTLYFFGGEPMLNLPVLIRTAEYTATRSREKGVKADFIISTNGSIGFRRFPDLCRFIRENNFRVNVSLDGPRETQNRNRPFKTSAERKGSFEIVLANLKELVEILGPEKVVVKVTMNNDETDIRKLVKPALEVGVTHFLVSPVVPSSFYCDGQVNFSKEDYQKMAERDSSFLLWYAEELGGNSELKIQSYHKLLSILYHSESIYQFCLAGLRLFCVFPNGDVYPCHRLGGEREFLLGNVNDKMVSEKSQQDRLLTAEKSMEEKCRQCWVRHFCWGNKCLQQNQIRHQPLSAINDPWFCEYHKNNLGLLAYSLSLMPAEQREKALKIR